ncbi:COL12A1 [Branchiostoma lanceolatum]|uniref:COL12A1 protein n=1 Tax=Branchiostoma lanceolatum TaxID=7740 RepID=A0A8J9ZI01_BRALA|nr:COL12A1 [Branchiostoma lanceolatum]
MGVASSRREPTVDIPDFILPSGVRVRFKRNVAAPTVAPTEPSITTSGCSNSTRVQQLKIGVRLNITRSSIEEARKVFLNATRAGRLGSLRVQNGSGSWELEQCPYRSPTNQTESQRIRVGVKLSLTTSAVGEAQSVFQNGVMAGRLGSLNVVPGSGYWDQCVSHSLTTPSSGPRSQRIRVGVHLNMTRSAHAEARELFLNKTKEGRLRSLRVVPRSGYWNQCGNVSIIPDRPTQRRRIQMVVKLSINESAIDEAQKLFLNMTGAGKLGSLTVVPGSGYWDQCPARVLTPTPKPLGRVLFGVELSVPVFAMNATRQVFEDHMQNNGTLGRLAVASDTAVFGAFRMYTSFILEQRYNDSLDDLMSLEARALIGRVESAVRMALTRVAGVQSVEFYDFRRSSSEKKPVSIVRLALGARSVTSAEQAICSCVRTGEIGTLTVDPGHCTFEAVPPTCRNTVDLVFLVESSDAVGQDGFPWVRRFITAVLGALTIGPEYFQIGVYQFSNAVRQVVPLGAYTESTDIQKQVRAMTLLGGETRLTSSMVYVLQNGFRANSRDDTPKVLVLLVSDNFTTSGLSMVAQHAAQNGVVVFGVGVGAGPLRGQLETLAGTTTAVNVATNFTGLKQVEKGVFNGLCNVGRFLYGQIVIRRRFNETLRDPTSQEFLNLTAQVNEGVTFQVVFENTPSCQDNIISTFNSTVSRGSIGTLVVDPTSAELGTGGGVYAYATITITSQCFMPALLDISSLEYRQFKIQLEVQLLNVFSTVEGIRSVQIQDISPGPSECSISVVIRLLLRARDFQRSQQIFIQTVSGGSLGTFTIDQSTVFFGRTEPVCRAPLDIFFVLDGSDNVGQANFDRVKAWVKAVVSGFSIGVNTTQIGLLQYSSQPRVEFSLGANRNLLDLLQAIDGVSYMTGGNNIGQALQTVSTSSLLLGNGTRTDARRVVILVSGGSSSDDVIKPAQQLQQTGAVVYAAGVGKYDVSELVNIASSARTMATVGNFAALDDLRTSLLSSVCTVPAPLVAYVSVNVRFTGDLLNPTSAAYSILVTQIRTELLFLFRDIVGFQGIAVTRFQQHVMNTTRVYLNLIVAPYISVAVEQRFLTVVDTGRIGSLVVIPGSLVILREGTTPPLKPVRCQNDVDLVFLLDSSSAVGQSGLQGIKKFMTSVVEALEIGQDHFQIGVYQFSDNVRQLVALGAYQNSMDIVQLVNETTLIGGQASLERSLIYVLRNGFRFNSREGKAKVVVVLTSEQNNVDSAGLLAQQAGQYGVVTFVIGVGAVPQRGQLERITGSSGAVSVVNSFSNLPQLDRAIVNSLCNVGRLLSGRFVIRTPFNETLRNTSSHYFKNLASQVNKGITGILNRDCVQRIVVTEFRGSGMSLNTEVSFQILGENTTLCLETLVGNFTSTVSTGRIGVLVVDASSGELGFEEGVTAYASLTITSQCFIAPLLDPSSPEHQELRIQLEVTTSAIFSNVSGIRSVQIQDISNGLTACSINVRLRLLIRTADFERSRQIFLQAIQGQSFGSFTVDSSAVFFGATEPVCRAPLDIIFVLDGSDSVGPTNFERVKAWVKAVVGDFAIGNNNTQLGLLQYGTHPRLEFSLDVFSSQQEVRDGIDGVTYIGGAANTGAALRALNSVGFAENNGARTSAAKVAIVVAAGTSSDDVASAARDVQMSSLRLLFKDIAGFYGAAVAGFRLGANNKVQVYVKVSVAAYISVTLRTRLETTVNTGSIGDLVVISGSSGVLREDIPLTVVSLVVRERCSGDLFDPMSPAYTRFVMRIESAMLSVLRHIPGLLSVQITNVGCLGLDIRITANIVLVSSASNAFVANFSAAVESGRVGNLTVDPSSLLFGKAALLCGSSLDIIYLVDGSGSVGANNFEKVKLFIKKAVSGFVIGPTATQVGVIQYSTRIRQEFSMNSFQTVEGLSGAIDAVEYMQGGTLTGSAIRYASKYGFSVFDGARQGVPKVLVVVTDGISSDEVAAPALEAQQKGIFVYAIGVSNYDANQLQQIASINETSAMVDNFNLLDSVRNTLLTSVCDVTPPVYASVILNIQFTTALRNPGSADYINLSTRVTTGMSSLFISIVGFRSVSVVGYRAAAGNRVKVVVAVYVAEFAATAFNQTFVSITRTGSIGSISVDASSAFVVGEALVCQNPLDIIFLIDGSGSVGASNFEKVKQFMQKTINGFGIGPNATQVGVIQYSSTVRQEFSMGTFQTSEAVSTVIQEIGYMRGGTLTGKAIRYVSRYGFSATDGARPGVPKVLIVVTDGVSYDEVEQPALEAQQKGILVFAIGVAGYDLGQLERIASSNRSLAVADNFNLLDSLRNSLLTGVCDVPSPVFISLTLTMQYSATMRNTTSAEFVSISTGITVELSRIFVDIPGFQSLAVVGLQPTSMNQVKVTIVIFVAQFSTTAMKETFTIAVQTGSLGSISVNASSAVVIEQALLCRTPLDIILLLDGSGSVGAYNFQKVKQFSQKIVETFDIGPLATQIGVIQYSSLVRQEFSMNSFQSRDALSNAIDDIRYLQGGTLTGRAIRYASRYGFARSDGARPGVAKVLIVVTDGISYDDVAQPAYQARQKGILVYAIGVSGYDFAQLEQIASNNRTLAVVDNFNLLDSLRNSLLTGVCDVVPPVFVSVTLNIQFSVQLRNSGSSEFSSITSILRTEISKLLISIVGFQGASIVGYQPARGNQARASVAVFVAEFAANTMKQTFITAVSTGNLGSISVNASSAIVVEQETNSTVVSLVVQDSCSADLLNPESATYIALVARVESAVLSIFGNIPGVVSIEVTSVSCSGLYIRVTITIVVVSTSSSTLVTTISTAVSSGNVGGLTVDPTSFASGDEALLCRTPLDIILLLDGSGSVGAYNFEKVKQFSQKMVETFDIGPLATQIGVIQYSSRVRQEFSMNSFQSRDALSNAIDDIRYLRGGTLTGRAIRYVSRYGFARSDGARPGVAKVLIVVTDGISYDNVAQPAYQARRKGILVYAIGVSGYDLAQLEQIASNNRTLAVVDNFNLLDSVRNSLLTGVCDATPPVFVCVTLNIQFSIRLRNPTSSEFSSITNGLKAELSQLFTSIVGFQGISIAGYQPAAGNQVKASIAVFVAEFAASNATQIFIAAVSTGNLGSISVNASSAIVVNQETNSTVVSLVVQDSCSADLLNPESATYIALVARVESAVLSIFGNIPGVVSIEVTSISCSGLYIRVTITIVVVSTSSSTLVTTISTAVSSGNVGGLTVDPTSFASGDEALLCRTPLDIILLLDGSGSVGAYNFEKVKQFSQKMVETFDIGPLATQIGVIQYSSRVRQEFSMNSFQSRDALSNAIDDIRYLRGGTLTGRAIRYVSRYGFARSDGARPGVAKVLIVVTDGISYDNVAQPAYQARRKGILVYAIGVSGYDLAQLEQIASNNRTLAVVDNFNLLDSVRNSLLTGVCDATPPVFVCVTLNIQFSIRLRNPTSSEFSSITNGLKAELSQLFTSIVGFQGISIAGYQPAAGNQVKASIAVFVAEFAASNATQIFIAAVSTGNLGSISVNASSAIVVNQETNSTVVSLVVQDSCSADLLNPESATYIALVARVESAVLSIFGNIPGVVSIEVTSISCSGLYIRVTITIVVVSTSSSTLVTTISTAVSSGNVGGLTVDPTSFASGDEALLCRTPLDIILLLDGSGSVGAYNFEKVKQFSQKMVETFDIGPLATQIGVIQYSSRVRQEFSMNSFQSRDALPTQSTTFDTCEAVP